MLKQLVGKYKHGFVFLYALIYLPWFIYLEKTIVSHYHVIHMEIDNYIPFMEIFIIPYLLWFAYCALAIAFFFFKDVEEFYRSFTYLVIGMTIFLLISTLYPNGHHLRPLVFQRDNIFVDMVKQLYKTDTPTNLFPSIHVYNSIVIHISIAKSKHFKKKLWVSAGSLLLCTSIVMSTVFLKQHSVFDVITAFILLALLYPFVYNLDFISSKKKKELKELT